jgi:hypothetical protein
MGGYSMNLSLDLGMMTNHRLSKSTEQSPELSESTCHTSVLKKVNRSFHTCVQDVQIRCTANSNGRAAQMLWLQHYHSISLTKWPLGVKKITEQGSITTFILSMAWTAPTGADRGRDLPSFLPLARTGLLDSIRLLNHLWQRKASFNRLMVALFSWVVTPWTSP